MRYIRLKCPKCDREKLVQLDRFNDDLGVTMTIAVETEELCFHCYHCGESYQVIETFDHNPIISEPISKVEKRNSL